jgi:hypothetical protein
MRTLEQAIAEADRKWARRRLWMTAAELIGIAVVAALLLFGCATVPQPIPMAQPVAADIGWACVGGTGPTPVVVVVPQSQLTCSNTTTVPQGFGCGRVGYPMLPSLPCVCVAGLEHGSPMQIARTGPPVFPALQEWHDTALVHEMEHRRLLQMGEDEDILHKGAVWLTTVPDCNTRLMEEGF